VTDAQILHSVILVDAETTVAVVVAVVLDVMTLVHQRTVAADVSLDTSTHE